MALTTSITPEVIAVALGVTSPSPTVEAQWQLWIDDALMLIEARVGSIDPVPTVDQARLDYVIREAVVAQARRPDDATQVTVSVDDGSTSRTYRSSTGRVSILDEWWALLGLTSDGGQAFTIDTAPGLGGVHSQICALAFGAAYCSCGSDLTRYEYPLYEGGRFW